MAAAARPGDDAAALGSGFLPAQPASHRSRDQWAARAGVRPGRSLRDPALHAAVPLPSPLSGDSPRTLVPCKAIPFGPSQIWGSV